MKVAVVGIGHVGLINAVTLASLGHEVTGSDSDETRVADLQAGRAPFHEPGLDDLLHGSSEQLRFTSSIADAVLGAAVVFVCIGRPPAASDRNLSAFEGVALEVARAGSDGVVLVMKSTVPPGTSERIAQLIAAERPNLDLLIASSPEFLREGHAIEDTMRPARLVVGAEDPRAFSVMRELYVELLDRGVRLFETDPRTAELSKLASNAFLATKISFANAIARVSEAAGADVERVTEIMGTDPRIGGAFLRAGLGYGGYCLPNDVATLERVADGLGYDFPLLREAVRINEEALDAVVTTIERTVWGLEGKTIALLGLAFKPGTDDVRGAPALALAGRLIAGGATVAGYDPMAGEAARAAGGAGLRPAADVYDAATGASCLVLCTEWPEFLHLEVARLKDVMIQPAVVDARNALDGASYVDAGFQYVPVGRPSGAS